MLERMSDGSVYIPREDHTLLGGILLSVIIAVIIFAPIIPAIFQSIRNAVVKAANGYPVRRPKEFLKLCVGPYFDFDYITIDQMCRNVGQVVNANPFLISRCRNMLSSPEGIEELYKELHENLVWIFETEDYKEQFPLKVPVVPLGADPNYVDVSSNNGLAMLLWLARHGKFHFVAPGHYFNLSGDPARRKIEVRFFKEIERILYVTSGSIIRLVYNPENRNQIMPACNLYAWRYKSDVCISQDEEYEEYYTEGKVFPVIDEYVRKDYIQRGIDTSGCEINKPTVPTPKISDYVYVATPNNSSDNYRPEPVKINPEIQPKTIEEDGLTVKPFRPMRQCSKCGKTEGVYEYHITARKVGTMYRVFCEDCLDEYIKELENNR